ncbi:4870_t:CDS:2, partial [Entrophospora sp. SA101]
MKKNWYLLSLFCASSGKPLVQKDLALLYITAIVKSHLPRRSREVEWSLLCKPNFSQSNSDFPDPIFT